MFFQGEWLKGLKHGPGLFTSVLRQETFQERWERGQQIEHVPVAYVPPRLMATLRMDKNAEEKQRLLAEIERLKTQQQPQKPPDEDNRCRVCYEKPIDCVLVKCGHLCVCHGCSQQLQTCPFCRLVIEQVVRTFRV